MMAQLMGGGGMPTEQPFAPQGQGPMYPTTDPNFMGELLGQIVAAQQADHEHLGADQQAALTSNPMFEALVAGSPLGPGAGQDGAAIGPDPITMPDL